MTYEVELKFRLADFQTVENQLQQLGAVESAAVSHTDRYFNHPSRDFRATDEAFRIRSVGDSNCMTYKGALIGHVAKTRHEIEVKFEQGSEATKRLLEIVDLLGFRFVREVKKTRRPFALHWKNRDFEVCLDEVPELGCFLEIELIAENEDRESAEAAVWELARQFGLSVAERRGYLHLLLESDGIQL